MANIKVKVIPKSRHRTVKYENKTLKVWVNSPPEDGKANTELVRILAKLFKIPKSYIKIIRGLSTRNKIVDITGISSSDIEKIASD